jgi:hypothetical protein
MAHELPRTVETILIGAAHIIKTRGWCRGALLDERGAVCLLGAIFEAGMRRSAAMFWGDGGECDAMTIRAWEVVERLINERDGRPDGGHLTIPGWNDLPTRTADDVLEILETAASVAAAVW